MARATRVMATTRMRAMEMAARVMATARKKAKAARAIVRISFVDISMMVT
jgi:hypothetical protein